MKETKFQRKKLNRKDHEKVDNAAKGVRNGIGIGTLVFVTGAVVFKVIKTVGKTITKL